ncbi:MULTISPECIES: tRNA pseudouridine(55) synthase TruB [unclassified Corynebacterium]|uniref:tRNA pseudouridine(55) synthase TruB n=1 Tax=unclassified Corynebacterium TaxID=2624378 RepID=UPI0008A253F3|nr:MULTISPECIES: tRNA pseudouridine(55) synthase TruB [unclassified Corynebacterium]OFO24898.1 tRNA pseudouridine(55) synthase [Corynebacterium sp. HMSC064E07]TXS69098.1 tRNA pseudouridine(55) synthase TruB [Corynebacterium sp. LK11]
MTDFDPIADSGIVIVDKPQDWTSHDVVGKLRRIFRTKKVGHSGTLDPMATGVLVLGIGRGTRFLPHVHADTKSYQATIRLGAATLTDDAEGELLSESSAASVTDEMVRAEIAKFTGTIMQKPAAVSAVKIDGVRAYERIRRGEKVDIPARPVTITRYEVLDIRHDSDPSRPGECIDIDVEVDCSAGTFIRALARDLGDALRVGGHLTALRRTAAGVFTIDEALTIDELTAKAEQFDTAHPEIAEMRRPVPERAASLLPMSLDEACLRCFDTREITEQQAADLAQGKWLEPIGKPGVYAAVSPTGKVPALLTESGKRAKTVFVVRPATL